jgi:hypothetical protein
MADTGRGVLALVRNWISMLGVAIVTVSALLFLIVFLIDLFGFHTNPYIGIVFFLIIPGAFIGGLLLIPIGMWRERRRLLRGLAPSRAKWPRLDLNDPVQRRATFSVIVLTFVNVVIVSLAAYKGIEFMDSPTFCGEVCHEVMQPEYAAYQDGPHSRVACVRCHIGPGAPWFVKAKVDGTRQVIAVLLNSHSRPIPSPVHTLRPAREVCEQCHWPEKFHGDMIRVKHDFADDEQVTESTTTLRLKVGGGSARTGVATGIHWHMSPANQVEYIATDDKRQVIPYVRVKDQSGEVREYYVEGVTPETLAAGERRLMDCMDCHNRPSHAFFASAQAAVDDAIAAGEISRSLPFVRREAVAALMVSHQTQASAIEDIGARLGGFYRGLDGTFAADNKAAIDRAIETTRRLYARNVFPQMNVTWGTYPNNIGHTIAPGCFRCHDDQHKTQDGRVIKQDCDLCHDIE